MDATTIAIVGRTNVGKSTLFNRLSDCRDAIVSDLPGVTRDYLCAEVQCAGRTLLLIDTAGIEPAKETELQIAITEKSLQIAREADFIFWVVDGQRELLTTEQTLLKPLRQLNKPIQILVNKTEGKDPNTAVSEFYELGLGNPRSISAKYGHGTKTLLNDIIPHLPTVQHNAASILVAGIKIALLGRPNVGKSTLINCMLSKQRMLTSNQPGTTRDSIMIPFTRKNKNYILIDTAGVRRKAKITDRIEKFSVVKTLKSISLASILILVVDAQAGICEQDANLLGLIIKSGKSFLIVINKWDGLERWQRTQLHHALTRKFAFVDRPLQHFISALHGSGVGKLFNSIDIIENTTKKASTLQPAKLTKFLQDIITAHPPPMVRGRRIKLRYAHIGGQNPLRIMVHGNQTQHIPLSYARYLTKEIAKKMHLHGTPLIVQFKKNHNPYSTT